MTAPELKTLVKIQRELQQSDFSGCGCNSNELWTKFSETYNRNLLLAFDSVDNEARAFLLNLINIKSK